MVEIWTHFSFPGVSRWSVLWLVLTAMAVSPTPAASMCPKSGGRGGSGVRSEEVGEGRRERDEGEMDR